MSMKNRDRILKRIKENDVKICRNDNLEDQVLSVIKDDNWFTSASIYEKLRVKFPMILRKSVTNFLRKLVDFGILEVAEGRRGTLGNVYIWRING